jgi:glutathione S-transferase
MSEITLNIFDYNYSSWSMRAGVLLRLSGLPFRERRFNLDDATRMNIGRVSSSRLLPAIEHDDLQVWDSLAIAEYVAELVPERALWPRDARARAVARSASAEMHSGFGALRNAMAMNIRAHYPRFPRPLEVERNVARIKELWTQLRRRFGATGDFLCGEFGIVDAMFAPVVTRFRTYDVKLDGVNESYAQAVLSHPAVESWLAEAATDTFHVPAYDYFVDL